MPTITLPPFFVRQPVIAVCTTAVLLLAVVGLTISCTSPSPETDELEELRALGYIDYSLDASSDRVGVILHDRSRTASGYREQRGVLIDDRGNVAFRLHTQGTSIVTEDGTVYSLSQKKALIKQTWLGETVWKQELPVHHDLTLTPTGTILIPSKEVRQYQGRKVEFDLVVEFSEAGVELTRWSTFDHLAELKRFHDPSPLDQPSSERSALRQQQSTTFGGDYDYYHLNSVQALPATGLGAEDRRFQEGHWLISMRNLNLILILDRHSKDVVWDFGPGELIGQHMPRMLDDGNILVFDNGGSRDRPYTRVIEIEPTTKEIVWTYTGSPPGSFFSVRCGGAQRLPNGNTLITDHDDGRAFEVTREGEIVWDWYNPTFNEKQERQLVYRMVFYPREMIEAISSSSVP